MNEKKMNDPNVATTNNIDTMKNRNVRLALLFTFLGSASRGVWAFVILSNFIHVLTDSTLNVGIAEGIQGFFTMHICIDCWVCSRQIFS